MLEKVVIGSNLQKTNGRSLWERLLSAAKISGTAQSTEEQVRTAQAVEKLGKDLKVALVRKTDLIR